MRLFWLSRLIQVISVHFICLQLLRVLIIICLWLMVLISSSVFVVCPMFFFLMVMLLSLLLLLVLVRIVSLIEFHSLLIVRFVMSWLPLRLYSISVSLLFDSCPNSSFLVDTVLRRNLYISPIVHYFHYDKGFS